MAKKSALNIIVRGQEAEDWEEIAALRSGPKVIDGTLQTPYLSRDVVRERLENPPPGRHGLVAVVDGLVVGNLGLQTGTGRRARTASLGMMVHDDFQGQGVGTALMEAAVNLAENWLNISRIELEVYTDNAAGIALYKKFGFEIEGTLRDFSYRNGHYADVYLMARIREDDSQ
jgi:L-phenylalanine/L-methionine N-acetyltransferase